MEKVFVFAHHFPHALKQNPWESHRAYLSRILSVTAFYFDFFVEIARMFVGFGLLAKYLHAAMNDIFERNGRGWLQETYMVEFSHLLVEHHQYLTTSYNCRVSSLKYSYYGEFECFCIWKSVYTTAWIFYELLMLFLFGGFLFRWCRLHIDFILKFNLTFSLSWFSNVIMMSAHDWKAIFWTQEILSLSLIIL